MEVTIRRAGLQTTIQDLGRAGYRADGVPLSGAMDRFALRLANLLVGNDENAAALEFTLMGAEVEFSQPTLIAVTGGDFSGPPRWQPLHVGAGEIVNFGPARSGCRGYLAIAGGFNAPLLLGSASLFVRGGMGGVYGRPLRDGDVLSAPEVHRSVAGHWTIDPRLVPNYSPAPVVRVLRAAQTSDFDRTFFDSEYEVTGHSDRMGVRFNGPVLRRQSEVELRSATVVPGTVQVPPDGHPIVLGADAQTIGGYPHIAHVISADQSLLAQLRPGNTVSFLETSLDEAHEVTLAREHALAMLRHGLAPKFS